MRVFVPITVLAGIEEEKSLLVHISFIWAKLHCSALLSFYSYSFIAIKNTFTFDTPEGKITWLLPTWNSKAQSIFIPIESIAL